MKENVGLVDRMIRFVIAIVFIVVGFTVSPWWFIVAAIALITGLTGWCALYAILGINTCAAEANAEKPSKVKPAKRKKR